MCFMFCVLHFILNMPQRFVCFVNSRISLHGLRFPLRFVFLQVEISSSCYCRGRAPPLTGKCFGCHLADIRQRCLPSFSPVPEGSGVVTGPALWWGLWSGAVCLLFCKTNKRMLCSAPARPSCWSLSSLSLRFAYQCAPLFSFVWFISPRSCSVRAVLNVNVHVFCLPGSSYLPKKKKN